MVSSRAAKDTDLEYRVRLTPEAKADLRGIRSFILQRASAPVAKAYVERITKFLADFRSFPERGSLRNEIRPGLRMIGFERRVTIAFLVDGEDVIVLRLLYAGRQFAPESP